MIEFDGEQYVTVREIAKHLKLSYGTCIKNVLPVLTKCYLLGRRRTVYKMSEVEQLSQVRTVEKQVQPLTLVKEVAS